MNPWCPNCTKPKERGMNSKASLLVTRSSSYTIEVYKSTLLRKLGLSIKGQLIRGGRRICWYCPKCKREWPKGQGSIEKK